MTGQSRAAGLALARHLTRTEVARDFALLIAMGGLASFAVLFTSRVVFDNVVHELSLSYAARLDDASARTSDLRLTVYDDANAAPREAISSPADMSASVNVTVLSFPGQIGPASRLLSGSVLGGRVCADGIVLDEATAARLDVRVGEAVTLWWGGGSETAPGVTRICGIANAWHPGDSSGDRGYVVAAATYLERISAGFPKGMHGRTADYWFDTRPPGTATRFETIRAAISRQSGLSGVVLAIVLLGTGLWSFAVVRVWHVLRRVLQVPWSVIHALGARPGLLSFLLTLAVTVMAASASILSAMVARTFILAWTDLYVTARQIWLITAVMIAVAVGSSTLLGRRLV
jgi:hypothetical protein